MEVSNTRVPTPEGSSVFDDQSRAADSFSSRVTLAQKRQREEEAVQQYLEEDDIDQGFIDEQFSHHTPASGDGEHMAKKLKLVKQKIAPTLNHGTSSSETSTNPKPSDTLPQDIGAEGTSDTRDIKETVKAQSDPPNRTSSAQSDPSNRPPSAQLEPTVHHEGSPRPTLGHSDHVNSDSSELLGSTALSQAPPSSSTYHGNENTQATADESLDTTEAKLLHHGSLAPVGESIEYSGGGDEESGNVEDEEEETRRLTRLGIEKRGGKYITHVSIDGQHREIYVHLSQPDQLSELQGHTQRDVRLALLNLGYYSAWNGGFLSGLDYLTVRHKHEEIKVEFERIKMHIDHVKLANSKEDMFSPYYKRCVAERDLYADWTKQLFAKEPIGAERGPITFEIIPINRTSKYIKPPVDTTNPVALEEAIFTLHTSIQKLSNQPEHHQRGRPKPEDKFSPFYLEVVAYRQELQAILHPGNKAAQDLVEAERDAERMARTRAAICHLCSGADHFMYDCQRNNRKINRGRGRGDRGRDDAAPRGGVAGRGGGVSGGQGGRGGGGGAHGHGVQALGHHGNGVAQAGMAGQGGNNVSGGRGGHGGGRGGITGNGHGGTHHGGTAPQGSTATQNANNVPTTRRAHDGRRGSTSSRGNRGMHHEGPTPQASTTTQTANNISGGRGGRGGGRGGARRRGQQRGGGRSDSAVATSLADHY